MTEHIITACAYLVLSAALTALLIWLERQTPKTLSALIGDYVTAEGVVAFLDALSWGKFYGWLFNGFILACSLDHLASDLLGHQSIVTQSLAVIEAVVSAFTAFVFVAPPLWFLVKRKWK